MLYREIIAVCSQIHPKHTNPLYGQNVQFMNVKLAVHKVTTVLQKYKFFSRRSRKPDCRSEIQAVTVFAWNLKARYRINNGPSLGPVLCQLNPRNPAAAAFLMARSSCYPLTR